MDRRHYGVMRYDRIIAIDPDVEKSGVAELHVATRRMVITSLAFPQLVEYLQHPIKEFADKGEKIIVVVEAGWLNEKSCFHEAQGRRAERVAKNVGANHETGRKIVEMAEHYGLATDSVRPLRKCWKGRDGKITAEELQAITGIHGRNNQDARDAALLAWVYAGFPVRIKP